MLKGRKMGADMLAGNRVEGLLPFRVSDHAGRTVYEYDITEMESLAESGSDQAELRIHSVIFALEALAETLDAYMLRACCVVPVPERIYLRPSTGQVCFVYDPENQIRLGDALQTLMEHYLRILNPCEEEVLLLYGLYHLTREPNVTLGSLAAYWRENCSETEIKSKVISTVGIAPENRRIYDELGLMLPDAVGQQKHKKRREIRTGGEPEQEYPSVFGTAAVEMADRRDPCSTAHPEWAAGRGDEPAQAVGVAEQFRKTLVEPAKMFLKKYGFEIAVITAAGAVLMYFALR